MDPIHAAYILSTLCAVAFFFLGLAVGRPKRRESDELKGLKTRTGDLEAERDSLTRRSQAEQELASRLSSDLAVAEGATELLRNEVASLRERVGQQDAQIRGLSDLRGTLEKELEDSVSRLAAAAPVPEGSGEASPPRTPSEARIPAELVDTKRRLSRELVIRAKLENQLAEANRRHSEDAAERTQLAQDLDRFRSDLRDAQDALAETKSTLRTQESAWSNRVEEERARVRSAEQRLAIVTHNLGDRESQLQAVESRLRNDLESAQHDLAELPGLKQQCAGLKADLEKLQKAKLASDRSVRELEATQNSLQTRLTIAELRAREAAQLENRVRELQEEVEERPDLAQASSDYEQTQKALKQLKLDHERASARVRELEIERTTLVDLQDRLTDLAREAAEAGQLRQQLSVLTAELYALGGQKPRSATVPIDVEPTGDAADALAYLLNSDFARSAVVADRHGLLVAAAGDSVPHEGLAALTGLAHQMADQARQLLPLGSIESVDLHASNQLVATCRLFEYAAESMAIAVLGPALPDRSLLDRTVTRVGVCLGLAPAPHPSDPGAGKISAAE